MLGACTSSTGSGTHKSGAAAAQASAVAAPTDWAFNASSAYPNRVAYRCSDGTRFDADVNNNRAVIHVAGKQLMLLHTPAASGARFELGDTVYWSRGAKASLKVDGVAHQCQASSALTA
ncbi:MliC family protein [Oleiagrimonas sp. C23AA]|uniref:MliC family protein n=1 Tax=Oleiagrimonas sp. C23AA TaxID=2719047 RepID=UPI00141DA958|nr:MliC family protein [Oleiagrimonas sp. C23AA]NII09288.1 lysozyme inhibitor [Oleiagrimonas sp. C23AA]